MGTYPNLNVYRRWGAKKYRKYIEKRTMSEGYENKKNGGRSSRFRSSLFVFGSD